MTRKTPPDATSKLRPPLAPGLPVDEHEEELIDEALTDLEKLDSQAAQLFKLRYFAGCSTEEAGEILEIPRATAYRLWTFARAWILKRLLPD